MKVLEGIIFLICAKVVHGEIYDLLNVIDLTFSNSNIAVNWVVELFGLDCDIRFLRLDFD